MRTYPNHEGAEVFVEYELTQRSARAPHSEGRRVIARFLWKKINRSHTHTTAEQSTHTNTERATAQRHLTVEVVVATPKIVLRRSTRHTHTHTTANNTPDTLDSCRKRATGHTQREKENNTHDTPLGLKVLCAPE